MAGYIFGRNDKDTPEALKRQREIAAAMRARAAGSAPRDVGEGLTSLGQAIAGAIMAARADGALKKGQSAAQGLFSDAFGGGSGAGLADFASQGGNAVNISADVSTPPDGLGGYISAATEKYGLPDGFLSRTAQLESNFGRNNDNPNSTASGPFQFIASTAKQYGLSNPMDPQASTDAAARLAVDNKRHLANVLGREPTAAELYLAHQQGAGGAAKLLGNPDARAVDLVGADAVRLNGGDASMTARDFAGKWLNKFGQQAPAFRGSPMLHDAVAHPTGQPANTEDKRLAPLGQPIGPEGEMLLAYNPPEAVPPAVSAVNAALPENTMPNVSVAGSFKALDPAGEGRRQIADALGRALGQGADIRKDGRGNMFQVPTAPNGQPLIDVPPQPRGMPAGNTVAPQAPMPDRRALGPDYDPSMPSYIQQDPLGGSLSTSPSENPVQRSIVEALTGRGGAQPPAGAVPSPAGPQMPARPNAAPAPSMGQRGPVAPQAPARPTPMAPQNPMAERTNLIRIASDPNFRFMSEPQQRLIINRIEQLSDPALGLDLQLKQAQLDKARAPDLTPAQQNYNLYVKQAKEAGQEPVSFTEWDRANKAAGAPPASEKKYDETMGKYFAETNQSILDAGRAAPGKIATYTQMREALQNPAILSGAGGDAMLALRRMGKFIGVDDANLSDAEFAKAVGNKIALELRNPAGGAGMPGALSDKDREFLVSMVPGLTKTPEGNAKLIDYMVKMERRNLEVARRAIEYQQQHGRLDSRFLSELATWADANPLFPQTAGNALQDKTDEEILRGLGVQ